MTKLLREDAGYSLVEVVVAMMILAIAILPMVSMFDAGLRAAVLGGNYDRARALAGKQLEAAKSLPYSEVRGDFPVSSSTPDPGTGVYQSADLTDPEFSNFSYRVRKEYVALEGGSIQPGNTARSLRRMMQVTVVVSWDSNEFRTTGLVARGSS